MKAFNHGYTLAKYEPALVQELLKTIEPTSDYTSGFISGGRECEKVQEANQLDEMKQLRNQNTERDIDLDM